MRRSRVRLSLQRSDVRGLQGIFQTQHHQERCIPVQVWEWLRNRHVYATQVSGVQTKEMFDGRYETGMRCARVPMCGKEKGEESTEGRTHDYRIFLYYTMSFFF